MRAGTIRHRVTIQEATISQDTYGDAIETWTDVETLWMSVEPLRGRELFQAQQKYAEVDTRIRGRYYSGITPRMRAVYDSRNYDIRSVLYIDERQKEVELLCIERA